MLLEQCVLFYALCAYTLYPDQVNLWITFLDFVPIGLAILRLESGPMQWGCFLRI